MFKNLKYFTYLFLFSVLFTSTYEITILLDDYSGLFQGAKVLSNQEKIGKIKLIEQNSDGKWLITLKIYEEYKNINSDMLFAIEGSSLFIDYAEMKLREKKEEERLAKIKVEEEKARQLKAAEEEKARQLKAAEEEKARQLKAAEEEARSKKEKLAKIDAEEEARSKKEKLAKIDAEEELLLLIKAEEERLAKIKAEEEEIRQLKIEQQQIASANADRERRKSVEARQAQAKAYEQNLEQERLAKIKAIEKSIEIDSIKSEIKHFYIYFGTHSHKFKNETFQNNLGSLIDIDESQWYPISWGFTGNIYRKFPFKFKYDVNWSGTSYKLLDEISFNINASDDSSLDSDGDGKIVFYEYDSVDFSLTSFNSSISFDLLPKFFIRPFIGVGYCYSTLEFKHEQWVDNFPVDFNRKQTFGNEFYIVNLIYEWKIDDEAINTYFDLSYRFSIKESELSFENIQFNIGIGK